MLAFPNAKINLGLYVTGKREDGYHNIESVFYPIQLTDVLEITKTVEPWNVKITGLDVEGDPQKNLCFRAARLFEERYNVPSSTIYLHKVIPMGAGLGGGSSDAAFTLRLLNDLNGKPASEEQLFEMAMQIGSDCGFFIHNKPCYVTGRGEQTKMIGLDLKGYFIVLVKPDVHVSTAEAYSMIKVGAPKSDLLKAIEQPVENWKEYISNDFEDAIATKFKVISEIKNDLYKNGALYASMSGSGSAVYGIFNKETDLKSTFSSFFYWAGSL